MVSCSWQGVRTLLSGCLMSAARWLSGCSKGTQSRYPTYHGLIVLVDVLSQPAAGVSLNRLDCSILIRFDVAVVILENFGGSFVQWKHVESYSQSCGTFLLVGREHVHSLKCKFWFYELGRGFFLSKKNPVFFIF